MLKASALYMVIVIALVIAIICSSLIVTAYFYRLQYQKTFRYDQLENNLGSAVTLLVSGSDTNYTTKTISLFNKEEDSVSTQRIFWGAFDMGIAKAFIQSDTLYKVFSMAHTIDSTKWAAIYLTDNDRPLSLSGKTMITGDVFIPPAGVNQAFLDNKPYTGDKRLIIGTRHSSEKSLPALDTVRLARFEQLMAQEHGNDKSFLKIDSVQNSFLLPVKIVNLGNDVSTLKNITLSGNIILFSDTALVIDSTAQLNNIMIFAKSIGVKSGFRGTCQLFATDTIGVGPNCRFGYPSCMGILRFTSSSQGRDQAKISLYGKSDFKGLLFAYEQHPGKLLPLIHIGAKCTITGQVYSPGYVEFENNAEIDGSVFTTRFLYQSLFTRYENYINNTTINSKLLSPYYLTSGLIPVATQKKKILQWMEAN